MRRVAVAVAGFILSTLCIAQTRVEAQAKSRECQAKYSPQLPAGAVAPKSDPIRVSPAQFQPAAAYACVLVTVDESGQLIDQRVIETDHAPFGEHLLDQVVHAKWRPAMLDGKPFTAQAVVSALYGP